MHLMVSVSHGLSFIRDARFAAEASEDMLKALEQVSVVSMAQVARDKHRLQTQRIASSLTQTSKEMELHEVKEDLARTEVRVLLTLTYVVSMLSPCVAVLLVFSSPLPSNKSAGRVVESQRRESESGAMENQNLGRRHQGPFAPEFQLLNFNSNTNVTLWRKKCRDIHINNFHPEF